MALDHTVQLFLATIDGRPGARDELLQRYWPRLVLWSAARLSPKLRAKMEPEDVAQETMLRVAQSLDGFVGRDYGRFRAWLFTIAHNAIRDLAKHHDAQKRQTPEPRSQTWTTPSQGAMRNEELDRMRRAISRLRDVDQEVIRLFYLEELPHAEVAEHLGRSTAAARILLCRALKSLRARLDADEGEGGGPAREGGAS